jgi:hypothetical protein
LIINLVTVKSLGLDTLRELEAAGPATGFQVQIVNGSTSREIDTAFAAFARERPDAVFSGKMHFSMAGASSSRIGRRGMGCR